MENNPCPKCNGKESYTYVPVGFINARLEALNNIGGKAEWNYYATSDSING